MVNGDRIHTRKLSIQRGEQRVGVVASGSDVA